MTLFRCVALLLLAGFSVSAAYAEPACKPTARVAANHYPGVEHIPPTNNLILPTGKSIEAEGQQLIVQGRLVDSRCMPLKEALVELWQVDPYGKYTLLQDDNAVTPRPEFAGAGRVITDMDGNFSFITGFPGIITYQVWEPYKVKIKGEVVVKRRLVTIRRAPHLNLMVKADGFQPFSTALFFDGDRRNADDIVFKKLSVAEQAGITLSMTQMGDDQVIASKEIVLQGNAPYRTY